MKKLGRHAGHTMGRNVGGLAQLVTRFGNEITQVVQDIHGAVANPFSLRGHDYTPAPMVYNLIRYGFRQAGNLAGMADLLADPQRELRDSLDLQSIINGIFGQLLVEQNNRYALPMTLLPKAPPSPEADTLVIFLHGLCMNEACWNSPAADAFCQWARQNLNADIRYLRYNTGLHISDNGRKLAGLLAHTALPERVILIGHSMGGHGALTLAMGLPGRFRSVSAFAPIANPTASDWGRKQLSAYLGDDETAWAPHDATLLMEANGFDGPILTDTGTADQFIDLLRPEALAAAVAEKRQQATLRLQPGYDHSYFFVSSFMEDHVAFHAAALWA